MSKYLVSVIIPLYNKEEYIIKSIQSVLEQSVSDFELLIIDDGSIDRSVEKVKTINDKRLFIIQQANAGVSAARNTGIKHASAEWIAFLDADDIWHSDHLKNLLQLKNDFPQHQFFSTRVTYDIKKIGAVIASNQEITNYPAFILKNNWCVHSSSVMASKQVWIAVEGFPVDENLGEDVVTWLKLSRLSTLVLSGITDVYYHTGDTNSLMHRENNLMNKPLKDDALVKYIDSLDDSFHYSKSEMEDLIELKYKMLLARAFTLIEYGDNKMARLFLEKSKKTGLYKKHWKICWVATSLPSFLSVLLTRLYHKIKSFD